jgi:hypothetical protein
MCLRRETRQAIVSLSDIDHPRDTAHGLSAHWPFCERKLDQWSEPILLKIETSYIKPADVASGAGNYVLATGDSTGYSMHGDFLNVYDW